MEKLLTKKTAKKVKRNEAIKETFDSLLRVGGMKQAIYEKLASDYHISITTVLRICK